MSDHILANTEAFDLLSEKLTDLANELSNAQSALRSVDITRCGIQNEETNLPVIQLHLSGSRFAPTTIAEAVRVYASALRTAADNTGELRTRVSDAKGVFSDGEMALVTLINGESEDDNADNTVRLLTDNASGTTVLMGRNIPGTSAKTLSEKEAKKLLDTIFGINAVKKTGFLFWTDYEPHPALNDIFRVLTGDTAGMTDAQIRAIKTDFVINAYAILLKRSEGLMDRDAYSMHYNAMLAYGEKLCGDAGDPSCGFFGYFKEKGVPGCDAFDSGFSNGKDIVDFALNSVHIIGIGADTISTHEANQILADLMDLAPVPEGPQSHLQRLANDTMADGIRTWNELTLHSDTTLDNAAELIHAVASSI